MRRLVDLNQEQRIKEPVLGMLTMAVVGDHGGLYDHRTGRAFASQLGEFFKFLTSKRTSEPFYWRFYAELQASQGQDADALESRVKQIRAAKARVFEERDPECFAR